MDENVVLQSAVRQAKSGMVFDTALASLVENGTTLLMGHAGYLKWQAASESNAYSFSRRLPAALKKGRNMACSVSGSTPPKRAPNWR